MPLEINYPHDYKRTISITLPEGYSVKNLDQLDTVAKVNLNGAESCKFLTTHTLKGNVLTINNIEFYKDTDYPINLYDDYVKVINSAADFNKIVLVLQKN